MKNYIYYTLIILLLVPSTSCKKDFLNDVNNGSALLTQDYVVNLQTTGEFLNGIYPLLSLFTYTGYQVIYPDLIADNIKPIVASAGATPLLTHYSWAQQADESSSVGIVSGAPNCNGTSYGAYQIIRACNFVLEKVAEYGSQDPAKANSLKGQAYTIRALVYFSLVNIFSQPYNYTANASHPGVVLVATSNLTEPITRRNTVAEVYNQLIADLNNAIPLLPSNTTTTLIINRNAAKALLARIYLFKGDFVSAKEFSTGVSRDVPIMITNYPSKLFTPQETEALFQLPPGVSSVNRYTTNFANLYFRSRIQFQATEDVARLLTESSTDARRAWVTASSNNWNITKYPSNATTDPTTDKANAYYQTVLRSSEMYLTAAECYAKLNKEDSALFYLNAIQKRANSNVTGSSITGAALLDSIYKERRKELAFEGLRMFDLLRWKKNVIRTDALSPSTQVLTLPNNKAIAPLPKLDVMVYGLFQNEEY